jgi:hypothetical protein
MKFTTEGDSKPREYTPQGTHMAVCYRIVDLGTQAVKGQYALDEKTGEQKYVRKVNIAFEIPAERMADGKPFNAFGTWDIPRKGGDKGRFRAIIKSWINKNVDDMEVEDIFLKGAMISITHTEKDGKIYENIGGIVPLPKGMPVPKNENEAYVFSLDEFDKDVFEKLPNWQREVIKESLEFKKMLAPKDKVELPNGVSDEDVPF